MKIAAVALALVFGCGTLTLVVLFLTDGKEKPSADPAAAAVVPAKTPPVTTPLPVVVPLPERLEPQVERGFSGDQVYRHILRSAVLVLKETGGGEVAGGSGVLVHENRRLILTNHHVAAAGEAVVVVFPDYDAEGGVIPDPKHYLENAKRLGRRGKVLASSAKLDLAVIGVDSLPDDVRAIPMAAKPADTGNTVYSVGGSGVDKGLLWRLSTGAVRGRARQNGLMQNGQVFDGMVLETQAPVNPGDSGGPVANDRAELVALVSHGALNERLVSGNVDLSEVRVFLTNFAERQGFEWEDAAPFALPPTQAELLVKKLAALNGPPADRADAIAWISKLGVPGRPHLAAVLTAADPPAEAVDKALELALPKFGQATAGDIPVLLRSLAGRSAVARRFALAAFAGPVAPPREAVPDLAKLLADPDPLARKTAATAVGRYGPGAKPDALAALLRSVADTDPEVSTAAAAAVVALRPYTPDHAATLQAALNPPIAAVRLVVLRELAAGPLAPDEVLRVYTPLLLDHSSALRAVAVRALAPSIDGRAAIQKSVALLLTDTLPDVRVELVGAFAAAGRSPDSLARLSKLVETDSDGGVRAAASDALLKLARPEVADLDLFRLLLTKGDPSARTRALDVAAKMGDTATPLLPSVAPLVSADEPAALAAVRFVGVLGPKAADLAPRVAALVPSDFAGSPELRTGPQAAPDDLAAAAITALGRLGPSGVKELVAVADRSKVKVRLAAADALIAAGPAAAGATRLMLAWLDAAASLTNEDEAGRPARRELSKKAAAVLAAVGGDAVADDLIARTEFQVVTRSGRKEYKVSGEVRPYAIVALGKLDPAKLTQAGRKKVVERLKYVRIYEPVPDYRELAASALAEFGDGK